MDGWYALAIGVSVMSNIAIIKWKLENGRLADGILDFSVLAILAYVFRETISGLTIGTIASSLFSIYLLISPPKFSKKEEEW